MHYYPIILIIVYLASRSSACPLYEDSFTYLEMVHLSNMSMSLNSLDGKVSSTRISAISCEVWSSGFMNFRLKSEHSWQWMLFACGDWDSTIE